MPTPRKPQDHKPETANTVEPMRYVALDGTEHLIDGALLVQTITPGWLRKARSKDEMSITFDLVELVADQALLDKLDASWAELARFGDEFAPYWQELLGASMGESSAS